MTRLADQPATPPDAHGYPPIGDYALIGDGRTVALVCKSGAIDWLPLPAIDQDTAFGALLDARQGGSFRLDVVGTTSVERAYVERTNVLRTTFATPDGTVEVTDALTFQDGGLLPWVELARRIRCTDGTATVEWRVEPAFGFAREQTSIELLGGIPVALGERLRLAVLAWEAGRPELEEGAVSGTVELAAGDSALLACVATDGEPVPVPSRDEIGARLEGTCAGWRRWADQQCYRGPHEDAVCRSALALKALTYAPSGALTAAATTALPERIGGKRNYDYRFCWIRDTAFALDSLEKLGYREEVHASLSWLLAASEPSHPRIEPFYALSGAVPRDVVSLDLDGYRHSRPVHAGNSAATQLQLGNYGDLFGTVWRYARGGNLVDPATGLRLAETADFVCRIWENDDAGLWELGEQRPYTSSKLSCWSALRRAADLAAHGHIPADGASRWLETADGIRAFIEERCWSEAKRSYTFYAGTDDLDCAVLRAPQYEFGDPQGERMQSTIDALRRELSPGRSLLYRYSGMEHEEGCFLACSFWLVTALAKAGRTEEANESMRELLEVANDVGLLSEEIDPKTLELLGNFPQALTHLALIEAACALSESEGEA